MNATDDHGDTDELAQLERSVVGSERENSHAKRGDRILLRPVVVNRASIVLPLLLALANACTATTAARRRHGRRSSRATRSRSPAFTERPQRCLGGRRR